MDHVSVFHGGVFFFFFNSKFKKIKGALRHEEKLKDCIGY